MERGFGAGAQSTFFSSWVVCVNSMCSPPTQEMQELSTKDEDGEGEGHEPRQGPDVVTPQEFDGGHS